MSCSQGWVADVTDDQRKALLACATLISGPAPFSPGNAQTLWQLARWTCAKAARADYWDSALQRNGSTIQAFYSPLRAALRAGVRTAGQYCRKWPRTRRSLREVDDLAKDTLAWIESARPKRQITHEEIAILGPDAVRIWIDRSIQGSQEAGL